MTEHDLPLEDELAIDRACLAFENDYRAQLSPSVDAHVAQAPERLRSELRQELTALVSELESVEMASARLIGPVSAPTSIGRYEVGRVVGEGGMGTVYEAQQHQPRRRVALKVIRADRVSGKEVNRFRREAGVLGHLHHPCIAQVYEAGTARSHETGVELPYLVMEFVDGPSLVDHVKGDGLDLRQRLALMTQICGAVQHAHDQGVIHRDLKPANILVRKGGASSRGERGHDNQLGRPVVLDFGLARATGVVGLESMETQAGQIVGTLSHMAPEQLAGAQDRVDGRADVYSLGVVLYELACGRLPLELAGMTMAEAVDAIRTFEPRPLGSHDPALRGDVELVCRKALEKESGKRYATPAELGADIQRILDEEPIRARPPSAIYQLRKFARRNPALVGSLAAAGAMLVIALSLVSYYAIREGKLRVAAETERDKVVAVGAFQAQVIGSANMEEGGRPRETTLLDALRSAAANIDGAYPDAPGVEATVRVQIGHALLSLSDVSEAEANFRRAHELLEGLHGERHADTIVALQGLARSLEADERFEEARLLAERVQVLSMELHGERDARTLTALNNLATLQESLGNYEESLALHRRALSLREEVFGTRSEDVSLSLNNLASLLEVMERWDEAEANYRRCLELRREILDPPHKLLANVINNLGGLLLRRGKLDESRQLLEEALTMRERLFGSEHPVVATTLNNLGVLANTSGDPKTAADLMARASGIHDRHFGEEHPSGDIFRTNVVILRRRAGQPAEAYKLQQRNLEILRATRGKDHEKTLRGQDVLIRCVLDMGELDRANELAENNLRDVRRALGECRLEATCLERLSEIAEAREQGAEALRYIREAVEVHSGLGSDDPRALSAQLTLSKTMYANGEREAGQAMAVELLGRCQEVLGDQHTCTGRVVSFLDSIR